MFRLFTTLAVISVIGTGVRAQEVTGQAADTTDAAATGYERPRHAATLQDYADAVAPHPTADTLSWYEKGFIGKVYRYFKDSNKQRTKNFDISFIGGPHYASEEGFGIGLAASGIYSDGGLQDTITPLSNHCAQMAT